MKWREVWNRTFHQLGSSGYIANAVVGMTFLLIGPALGAFMQNKRVIIYAAAIGLTILVWLVAFVADRQVAAPATHPSEAGRRSELLERLRQEYILSHDGISPALMAGTEAPPSDWVDRRLAHLGENWRVTDKPKA